MSERPAVSVILPFAGGRAAGQALLSDLEALRLGRADELVVVDNSVGATLSGEPHGTRASIVRADGVRSSYHARNVGASQARGEWLLFVDADCRPAATLLDDYLSQPVGPRTGAVAGTVVAEGGGEGAIARHSRSRPYLDQATFLAEPRGGFAVTANLLVRRSAWAQLGGFAEVRSGADVDFSWRLQAAGWEIEHRPRAVVAHRHRDALGPFVRQRLRYGAGERWLAKRWPGRRSLLDIVPAAARRLIAGVLFAARGRREEGLGALLDALAFGAEAAGWALSNRPPRWPRRAQ